MPHGRYSERKERQPAEFMSAYVQSSHLNSEPWVLLTGATGLLGSAILRELLVRGHRVLCVVRAVTPGAARRNLASALAAWGTSAESSLECGQLAAIRGDLCRHQLGFSPALTQRLCGMVGSVVHAAGSTAFSTKVDANLIRTNVEGTRNLFEFAVGCQCNDWHLISSAYVCGKTDRATEVFHQSPQAFRNEYEWTKWTAELETHSLAARCGASLRTYRPGVIVGHSETGYISRFAGIHRVFRAVSLLARVVEQRDGVDRHDIPLRIPANENARPNLMFVDDVAREFAELFESPDARGGIFHLTHPDPPTNGEIQQALEQYYDISGGRFVGSQHPVRRSEQSAFEELFFDLVLDTEPHILESPLFERTQTNRFVARRPKSWNGERLRKQIHFAESANWRRKAPLGVEGDDTSDAYAAYFKQFMPESHRRFRFSELSALNLIVRYVIGRSPGGDWSCNYQCGGLVDVGHPKGVAADVTYRITPSAFWSIVGGKSSVEEYFLSGAVLIEGQMERALKFAAVLREFVREFPYFRPGEIRVGN